MDKVGIALTGLSIVIIIAMCAVPPEVESAPDREYELASAYHCGVLDATQTKIGRGRACDTYKEIARKRGVNVPP